MGAHVTVFTPDVVGSRMAGPGIRSYHFAREISASFETVLVAALGDPDDLNLDGVRLVPSGTPEARDALASAAIVVGQPHRETLRRAGAGRRTIFDLFDPVILELDQMRSGVKGRIHRILESRRLVSAIRRGESLIVATPAQRELYGRVARRHGLGIDEGRWIEVPFGVPAEPAPVVEKASPPVVVWNGGVWPWLDPGTAVEAIVEVNRRGTAARLSFMGTGRPNPEVTGALPANVLETNELVEWNRDWVPYLERGEVLGRATISLMLHGATEESIYSIRTRLFDAIWCGIPVIATAGGFAAELVESEGLGIVVPPGDVQRVADAIEKIVSDDVFRSRSVSALMGVRDRFRWSRVCRPLLDEISRSIG